MEIICSDSPVSPKIILLCLGGQDLTEVWLLSFFFFFSFLLSFFEPSREESGGGSENGLTVLEAEF